MAVDTKRFTKEYIQTLLMREDDVGMHSVGRALVELTKRQTASERESKEVLRNNAKGFTPSDAFMGTSVAQFYTERQFLSRKQLDYWRQPNARGIPRICKYWGQLRDIAMRKHGIQKRSRSTRADDDLLDDQDP